MSGPALHELRGAPVAPEGPGPATPAPPDIRTVAPRPAPAAADPGFAASMRERHERLGAAPASQQALEAWLGGRVDLVVTGQQPGLFGGALYCASKVAHAIGLARRRSTAGRPTVAAYWCGADDADFAELRDAWMWGGRGPVRARAPRSAWEPGQPVGDLDGARARALCGGLLGELPNTPGRRWLQERQERRPAGLDWGEEAMALLLELFAGEPLVVFDARDTRLRELGRELFTAYGRRHRELGALVREQGAALQVAGQPVALDDQALESGLFLVEGGRRRKLGATELDGALPAGELAPSVLLRPLWQDALLAPVAAVLGPSELAYHRQLAPIYPALDVVAAAAIPRLSLRLWPGALPWPGEGDLPDGLLDGGEATRAALGQLAREDLWGGPLSRWAARLEEAHRELAGAVDEPAAIGRARARIGDERRRLLLALGDRARERRAGDEAWWVHAPELMGWRGTPQERHYSLALGWWWHGPGFARELATVADRAAADPSRAQHFVLHGGPA